MKALLLALALLVTPTVAHADAAQPPAARPTKTTKTTDDARLVPVMRNGVFAGIKVYAIKAGGRFDQPTAKFLAGDVIEQIDGEPVMTDAGNRALAYNVIEGRADAQVTVRRRGELVTLHSKALPR